jgi:hypothetical protein
MIRRLALAIVRRYPAAWRERYEAEVSALLEDSPTQLKDLIELLRGLITERARELISADDRPRRTAAVLTWMPAIFMAAFTAMAAGIGLVLRGSTAVWSPAEREVFGIGVTVLVVALAAVRLVLDIRHARRPKPKPARAEMPAWIGALLLPCLFLAVVGTAWGDLFLAGTGSKPLAWWLTAFTRGWLYFMALGDLASSFWPGRDVLQALGQLEVAEGHLRMNEAWARRCQELIAEGVPSPLNDALAQVGRWTIERDAARARLRELGYGARFRASI